ncbi:MAG: hypothetical protein IKE56_03910 [Lachnospiraceae bacterium]|jgi:hypothetical protein|nr:hypothetical protein [Lachnospiraceae bacterium]MBR2531796.1 hypothetical protein [Lachnospiraceae bacterium]
MAQKEKKGPMTALWLGLGFLVFAAIILFIAYRMIFPSDNGRWDPLGGAKIKTQEIWSADGLSVSVTGTGRYTSGSQERDALYLKVKNDGSSAKILRCTALSANGGAAVQPELKIEAAPGASTDGVLLFDRSGLYDMQIIYVGEIELELAAYDASSMAETARSGKITIKTNKAKKADTPKFLYKTNEFYNADGISLATADLSVAYTDTSSALRFYVENTSGRDIRIVPGDVKFNGKAYEVARKNVDGSVYDTRGVGEGYTFQNGSKGSFYYELEWEPLEDVLPLDMMTGVCRIYDNVSGQLLKEAEFTFKP